LLPIVLPNILYKILFIKKFVGNDCKFYNFVRNNYPRRITYQLKLLEKMAKQVFSCKFFKKFAKTKNAMKYENF